MNFVDDFINLKMFIKETWLFFVLIVCQCRADFVIPEVTIEALEPKGFRASIPALDGIQLFAFHGKLNKPIPIVDPGDFSGDLTSPKNNLWIYENNDLVLKKGDVIHYWIFVQHNKLGYRKDALKWNVEELVKEGATGCQLSPSLAAKKTHLCKGAVILEDNFTDNTINANQWTVEEFIPMYSSYSENYEFVSYRRSSCSVKEGKLLIKPQALQREDDVRGRLDLRASCTRDPNGDECHYEQQGVYILPPVISGRLVSVTNFRYGKVEVKAKLPEGDWIYPQIYLEQVNDPKKKIWIAYSRGNRHLLADNKNDIGGSLLFGGIVLDPKEPQRSENLRSRYNQSPFSSETHTYTVIWSKDRISLQIDGTEYGTIDSNKLRDLRFSENDMVRLVLGVGVGGINDFPDGFKSGSDLKPWQNKHPHQGKKFFDARSKWSKTWQGDNSALQIDYVKITAL